MRRKKKHYLLLVHVGLITLGGVVIAILAGIAAIGSWDHELGVSHAGATEAMSENDKPAPDNSPWFVCHANFEDEPLSTRHFKAKIGCVNCHGESFAHRSDENNTTPPDRMYAAEDIEPACKQCHKTHNVSARKVVEVYLKRCKDISDPKKLTCTNCHGQHRMYQRTIIWNKRTGELIPPDSPGSENGGQKP
ncbi:MAG: hypothetical protein ACUVQG_11905 [Thermogutta sp.]